MWVVLGVLTFWLIVGLALISIWSYCESERAYKEYNRRQTPPKGV
jgi:hypothetical protein